GFLFACVATPAFAQATPPPAQATTPPPTVRMTTPPPPDRLTTSPPSRLKAFTVTLVLGDTQAGTSDSKLDPRASKALAELTDFLPYKKYTLLDTAPIIGMSSPNLILSAYDQKYEFGWSGKDLSEKTTQVDQLRLWQMPTEKRGGVLLIDTAFKIDVG